VFSSHVVAPRIPRQGIVWFFGKRLSYSPFSWKVLFLGSMVDKKPTGDNPWATADVVEHALSAFLLFHFDINPFRGDCRIFRQGEG
jgi:hypothetical protein